MLKLDTAYFQNLNKKKKKEMDKLSQTWDFNEDIRRSSS